MMRMRRLLGLIMCAVTVALACAMTVVGTDITAYAADDKAYVYDYADILTDKEEERLAKYCAKASKACDCDFVIITTSIGHDYAVMDSYMWDLVDDEGYADDAIVFGIDMVSRADRIVTRGKAKSDISQSTLDDIREDSENDLSDEDYYYACKEFISNSELRLTNSIMPKLTYKMWVKLLISAIVTLIAVFAMMSSAKSKMTVASTQYTRDHSFRVNEKKDRFINTTVVKRHISSSSGGSSGGGGGGGGNSGSSGGHF